MCIALLKWFLFIAWGFFSLKAAYAIDVLPKDGVVHNGAISIQQHDNTMTIHQATDKGIIHWQSFDIGADNHVHFEQPSASASTLNRVVGGGKPSDISGRLTATGNVMLVNPNGVVIKPGASIDVGGLIASTANITDHHYLNNKLIFDQEGNPSAQIINDGNITVKEAGLAALVAPNVRNNGVIAAKRGTVVIAGAEKATLDFYGDGLIKIAVETRDVATLIENNGAIMADEGTIIMTAAAAKGLVASTLQHNGTSKAMGGRIVMSADDTRISGRLNVAHATKAGRIEIGNHPQRATIPLPPTRTLKIDSTAQLDASATLNGDGGQIIAWADDKAQYAGQLLAQGGAIGGNGGFIETSGALVTIDNDVRVDTSALEGRYGDWLIDPLNFTIQAGFSGGASSGIDSAVLVSQLASNNVTIETVDTGGEDGDIFVNSALVWSAATQLSLYAHRHIDITAPISNTNGGSLLLRADRFGVGTGTVSFSGTGAVTTTGGSARTDIYYNPAVFGTAFNFTPFVTGTFDAWQLVNTAANLQFIDSSTTTRAGTYALGKDLDLTSIANFDPIGQTNDANSFTGKFDGLGKVISNLTISRSTTNNIGLFGRTSNATIRNVGIVGGSVTGQQNVGGLVGAAINTTVDNSYTNLPISATNVNSGGLVGYSLINSLISNSYALGNVSSTSTSVGGLVGRVDATARIEQSYAEGNIIGTNSNDRGGLVGLNNGGHIEYSYAMGNVENTGTGGGGLVGRNTANGEIWHSYATGDVETTSNQRGGLVGDNTAGGKIYYSYATGNVTGSSGNNLGGLVGRNTGAGSTIEYSYATGNVTGAGSNRGGLVGQNTTGAIINASYATGNITGSGTSRGGLVGQNNGSTISNSYATGSVLGTGIRRGGLVGNNQGGSAISNSFATAFVNPASGGDTDIGGLVGRNNFSTVTNSFWATDTTGQAASAGGAGAQGRTLAQMNLASNYAGWDISTTGGSTAIWRIYDGTTLPLIRALLTPATVSYNVSKTYDKIAYTPTLAQLTGDTVDAGLVTFNGTGIGATTVGTYTINLSSAQNGYDLTQTVNTLTITPRALTLDGIGVAGKEYDGNTSINVDISSLSLVNAVSGDDINFNPTGFSVSFDSKNAGTRGVVLAGGTLTGTDAGNYSLSYASPLTASITPRLITIDGLIALNKVFDGTTQTKAFNLSNVQLLGKIVGDTIELLPSSIEGVFANRAAGVWEVAVNASLTGGDAKNYTLQLPYITQARILLPTQGNDFVQRLYKVLPENFALTQRISMTPAIPPFEYTYIQNADAMLPLSQSGALILNDEEERLRRRRLRL